MAFVWFSVLCALPFCTVFSTRTAQSLVKGKAFMAFKLFD